MITQKQVQEYDEKGFIVVENALAPDELAELRRVTDELCEKARGLSGNDATYDLEDSHTPDDPRVRRIKNPDKAHPFYAKLYRSPRIMAALTPLIGPAIRFQTAKLNMKSAKFGAPVEWHQDWAFYPHTNDDLLAIGILLDDCYEENGPLMVVPGSHKGPILDHHADGHFCGACDPAAAGVDVSTAERLMGPAGSMTVHHVRAIHGSDLNRSDRPRRLLLFQYTAVDAWPLLGCPDWQDFNARIVTGEPTNRPRMTAVPVQLPVPPAPFQGSIYENQRATGRRYFGTYAEEREKEAVDA